MGALDGREAWSVEALIPDCFHVDPGVLIERVVVETIAVLNELMSLTPVELPSGSTLTERDGIAPDDGPFA